MIDLRSLVGVSTTLRNRGTYSHRWRKLNSCRNTASIKCRRGYVSLEDSSEIAAEIERSDRKRPPGAGLETGGKSEKKFAEAGLSLAVYADMKEVVRHLKQQPLVLELGITHDI